MAPLPPIWDPARAADKLPQPYRMIDKLVAEIVEKALGEIASKAELRKLERATNIGMRFAPHAIMMADGAATCFTTPGIAGLVVVGTASGEIYALTARDLEAVGRDHPHDSPVAAMDSGHVPATGTKVVVSASRGHLAVHELMVKTAELTALAKTELPSDPDNLDEPPCSVAFSMNAGHVAVCYSSGALAVYEVNLPPAYYAAVASKAEPPAPTPAPDAAPVGAEGSFRLVLHMTVAAVKGLLVGSTTIGTCHVEWQLQQRPDKSGKSDRFHKPARGVYMWWKGCNGLALSYLDGSVAPDPPAATPAAPPPSATLIKPTTPLKGAPPKTPPPGKGAAGAAAGAAASAAEAAAAAAAQEAAQADGSRVQRRPFKSWKLPHQLTCSCSTQDGTMLAFGMADGSVVVWDDHFGGHIRILPRMLAAVSAMAYVNGMPSRLFCTSVDGSVYIADFARPEDSYTANVKLPSAAANVYFLPSDPFAICMCPGPQGPGAKPPRFVWYDMTEQKLVAECVGKSQELNFGMAFIDQHFVKQSCEWVKDPGAPEGQAAAAPAAAAGAAAAEAGAKQPEPSCGSNMSTHPGALFPRWDLKESYFIAGGPLQRSTSFRPPNGMLPEEVPDEEWPREAVLLLYKVDALARYLMPEENESKSSKSLLERMLAELDPPKRSKGKHVKYGVPDPDAPKPPASALRRAGSASSDAAAEDDDDTRSISSAHNRHIAFEGEDGLFDDATKTDKKQFKKETRKGGYSEGVSKPVMDLTQGGTIDLSQLSQQQQAARGPVQPERARSPPWHHTNPLARIHPDWEEAPVLARIMDRIGSKGGGRKKRDRRLVMVASEMSTKLAKEAGPKPVLLTKS